MPEPIALTDTLTISAAERAGMTEADLGARVYGWAQGRPWLADSLPDGSLIFRTAPVSEAAQQVLDGMGPAGQEAVALTRGVTKALAGVASMVADLEDQRDDARRMAVLLEQDAAEGRALLQALVSATPQGTFAGTADALDKAKAFLNRDPLE